MAWTTISAPVENTPYPVYNKIVFKVYDSSYILTNYKYTAKILRKPSETSADEVIGTHTFYPLQDGTCEIDVAPILRDYITNNFDDYNIAGFKDLTTNTVKYTIAWYRSYNSKVNEFVKYENWRYAYDGAVSIPEFTNYSTIYETKLRPRILTDPINMGSVTSNVPSTLSLKLKDYYTIDTMTCYPISGWFSSLIAKYVKKIDIYTYSSNYLFGYHVYSLNRLSANNSNFFDPTKLWMRIGIGPANLNAIPEATWDYVGPNQTGIDGAYPLFPVIDNYCDFYEIVFIAQDNVSCLQTIRVYPDLYTKDTMFPNVLGTAGHCTYKELPQYWLVYKNKYGAYSWLPFFSNAIKSIDIKKNTYQKRLPYNASIYTRGQTTIGSEIKESYTLNSLYVPQCESIFFEELLCSPSVYILKPTLESGAARPYEPVLPVTIKDASYQIQEKKNVKLVQYSIEVESHSPKIIQRS